MSETNTPLKLDPRKLDSLVRDLLLTLDTRVVVRVRGGEIVDAEKIDLPLWALGEMVRVSGVTNGLVQLPSGEDILASRRADAQSAEIKAGMLKNNPFDKNSRAWNITRQIELQRSSPELAAELKAAAGVI